MNSSSRTPAPGSGSIAERAEPPIDADRAAAISAAGLGSLFSSRLLRDVLAVPFPVNDHALLDTWVQMMMTMLTS